MYEVRVWVEFCIFFFRVCPKSWILFFFLSYIRKNFHIYILSAEEGKKFQHSYTIVINIFFCTLLVGNSMFAQLYIVMTFINVIQYFKFFFCTFFLSLTRHSVNRKIISVTLTLHCMSEQKSNHQSLITKYSGLFNNFFPYFVWFLSHDPSESAKWERERDFYVKKCIQNVFFWEEGGEGGWKREREWEIYVTDNDQQLPTECASVLTWTYFFFGGREKKRRKKENIFTEENSLSHFFYSLSLSWTFLLYVYKTDSHASSAHEWWVKNNKT